MPSNFTSSEPFSAVWSYRDGSVDNTCATTGRAFGYRLRAALGLPAGWVWDAEVQAAIVARVTALNVANPNAGWAPVLQAVVADAQRQQVSGLSLVVAIYFAYYEASRRRLDAIVVSRDAIMPLWGITPPEESTPMAGLVCWIPTTDPPASILSARDLAQAIADSSTGIRVGAGRAVPRGPTVVAPGVGAGLGMWGVLGVGLAILGLGYLATRD